MSDFLTVVSGLPRSGTSLMMAALQAGGLPLVTDGARQPDIHNPAGYFEDQRVKTLHSDADWLLGCAGQAVKVLFHQLKHVPAGLPVKVILMTRHLHEVVESQNKMLGGPPDQSRDWVQIFAEQLCELESWLKRQTGWQYITVDYHRLLDQPEREFASLCSFLGLALAVPRMVACVDPGLYRNRVGP